MNQFRKEKILIGQGTDKISSALLLIREISVKTTGYFSSYQQRLQRYETFDSITEKEKTIRREIVE